MTGDGRAPRPMGLEFLARVRRATFVVAALAFVTGVTYQGLGYGSALALGAIWCLTNLFLIERLVIVITGENRGTGAALRSAGLTGLGMVALFGAGALLLTRLPVVPLMVGFGCPFAVLVLKAASTLLVETPAWRRFTASTWQVALVAVLVAGALWAVSNRVRAQEHGAAPAAVEQAAEGHAEAGASGEAGGTGPPEFPNLVLMLAGAGHGTAWGAALHHWEPVIFSMLVGVLLCVLAFVASKRRDLVPGPFQNAVEYVVEALADFVTGVLGPVHGPRYLPFLGSLFLYILINNWIGFIPFMKAGTSNINVTAGLALTVFLFVQYTGIRELGPKGYIDHLIGAPRSVIEWGLVPIMLPIHIIGELAKPLSLACRLFGNIFGEDMLLVGFSTLGIMALSAFHSPVGIPFQLPFLFFALLTSSLQALVFTTLSTVYFLLMLPHDDHGHGEEGHTAPQGAH